MLAQGILGWGSWEAGMEEFNIIIPRTPGERTNCSPNSQVGKVHFLLINLFHNLMGKV